MQIIIASILKIIEYIASIFANRAKDNALTDNELAKKINQESDKHNELINKSLKGDKKALDEIRKNISI